MNDYPRARTEKTPSMFRVFIGSWDDGDPDWTGFDVGGLWWEEARALLAVSLERWRNDSCEFCRDQAATELARLQAAAPGRFEAEVEGDDYLIIEE